MAALASYQFTDIILAADQSVRFLKGVPGQGQSLISPRDELQREISLLGETLECAYAGRDEGISLRLEFNGMAFRSAVYDDLTYGKIFFLRRIPERIRKFSQLGLPKPVAAWLMSESLQKGLILISGAQASGKTTTASSFVSARLQRFGGHGVTFEQPVEMPLSGPHGSAGYCFQTDILTEAELPSHIERAHRFSAPNIIYVGEIRARYAAAEVLRTALGSDRQIVIATIHGTGVITALDRLLSWARELEGVVACQTLAQTLAAIVHQELDFSGDTTRLTAREFLLLSEEEEVVRAKLRDGNLFLNDNIREQRNKLVYGVSL